MPYGNVGGVGNMGSDTSSAAVSAGPDQASGSGGSAASKKILIADDEAHVLAVLSMKLRSAGYEVITANNGRQALELCQTERPDLLVTDCQMPLLDGLGLCRELSLSDQTRSMPRIMLTSRQFEITDDQMQAAGISILMAKPFSPKELVEKVRGLVRTNLTDPPRRAQPEATTQAGNGEPGVLDALFGRIEPKLSRLGMDLSVWGADGKALATSQPCNEFCGMLADLAKGRDSAMGELVGEALSGASQGLARYWGGLGVICMPIRWDGGLLGAATVSYPLRELLADDALDGLCRQTGQDRSQLAAMARKACRNGREDEGQLLLSLGWMLEGELERQRAEVRLADLSANLTTTYEELNLAYRISGLINVTQPSEQFLQTLCDGSLEVMGASSALAVAYAGPGQDSDLVVSAGEPVTGAESRLTAAAHIAGKLAEANGAIIDNDFNPPPEAGFDGSSRNLIAAQLAAGDNPVGMLVGLKKTSGDFTTIDLKLMNSIASQAGVFLANSGLYAELDELFLGVVHALSGALDAKDAYTQCHSQRVAQMSQLLAEKLGLSAAAVRQLHLGGMLHDVGKIGVPEQTLFKPDRLTEEEFEQIKQHPVIGARILSGIRQLRVGAVLGIRTHHERIDGRGYPEGLKGDQIPMEGRIIGLADCFDAMTSDRRYRRAMSMEAAIEEIRRCSGTQFDPAVAESFLSLDLCRFVD